MGNREGARAREDKTMKPLSDDELTEYLQKLEAHLQWCPSSHY